LRLDPLCRAVAEEEPGRVALEAICHADELLRELLEIEHHTVDGRQRTLREIVHARALGDLLLRRPVNVATVALANKNARIAWALMVRNDTFQARIAPRARAA
jgi:hypothetical protein